MRRFKITIDDKIYDVAVEERGESPTVAPKPAALPASSTGSVRIAPPAASQSSSTPVGGGGPNDVSSPLSGTVIEIHINEGQAVQQGDKLITLEAMKMNTAISASRSGNVQSIMAQVGSSVQEGQVLLTLS